MQPFKIIQVYGWPAFPTIFCYGPAHFATLKSLFVLMLCKLFTTFKWTAGRAPPNTVQAVSRCWNIFSSGWYEAFQNHSILWLGRAPPRTAQFYSRCWKLFRLNVMQPHENHSSLWLGCAPQHPLSRPSSFRSVELFFRGDVIETFNNVQINGWSCSPKHDPAHFTVLKRFFVRMVRSFSKTFKFMAGPCSPKHGPVLVTVLKNLFVWCYAKCQQRSIERLVVLPQTRSSSFHVLKDLFVWMVWSFSKTTNFPVKLTASRAPPNTIQLISRC